MKILIRILLVITCTLSRLVYGEFISVTEVRSKIVENSLQKLKSESESQKNNLGIKNDFNRFTPELSVFGGIKSKEKEFELENDHFLGLRSQYKILDGGERNLLIQRNEKEFSRSEQSENRLKLQHELEVLRLFAKESSLKEKHELIKIQLVFLSESLKSAELKKRAGVMSELDYKKISTIKSQIDHQSKLIDSELNITKLEKIKKFNSQKIDQDYSLKESLDQINEYIENSKLTRQLLDLSKKQLDLENDVNKLEYVISKNVVRPEVKAFVEKSFTRKIEGQFLDGDDTGSLTMGLEFEIPIVSENNENFTAAYKSRLAEKILEIEKQEISNNYEINSKIIDAKLVSNQLRIENSKKSIQEKGSLVLQKENGVKNGLVNYIEYIESNFELFSHKLELVDLKEVRNSLLTSFDND